MRELERKQPPNLYQDTLALFKQVLAQKKTDSNKIYLHYIGTTCSMHQQRTRTQEICIWIQGIGHHHKRYRRNYWRYQHRKKTYTNSKTLQPAIEQQQRLTGIMLKNNFVDCGYRGEKE